MSGRGVVETETGGAEHLHGYSFRASVFLLRSWRSCSNLQCSGEVQPKASESTTLHGLVARGVAVASRAHASIDILDQIFNRALDRPRIGIGS